MQLLGQIDYQAHLGTVVPSSLVFLVLLVDMRRPSLWMVTIVRLLFTYWSLISFDLNHLGLLFFALFLGSNKMDSVLTVLSRSLGKVVYPYLCLIVLLLWGAVSLLLFVGGTSYFFLEKTFPVVEFLWIMGLLLLLEPVIRAALGLPVWCEFSDSVGVLQLIPLSCLVELLAVKLLKRGLEEAG